MSEIAEKGGVYMNATNQELSLNKLIILYMLNVLNIPITNSKISEFILNHEYTNYFSLQEYINQMAEAGLLEVSTVEHKTLYSITESGVKTLEFFENRIPQSTKEDIHRYLKNNKLEIKSTLEIVADYIPGKNGDYLVHCLSKEKNEIILELNLTVYDHEHAVKICDNFKARSHEIYKRLLSDLMEDNNA